MMGRTLFFGLGSIHGDDQIGLLIAKEIASRMGSEIEVVLAGSPAEILNRLDDVDHLVVCDACLCRAPPGTMHHWEWPTAELEQTRFVGSHNLTLPAVLSLAEQLGCLPAQVTIWGIAVELAHPTDSLSATIAALLPNIVEQICNSLGAHKQIKVTAHA